MTKGIPVALKRWVMRNSHKIMTGMSLAGLGATVGLAIHDTLQCSDRIEELKDEDPGISQKDLVIKVIPTYIPTGLAVVATAGCILGTHQVSEKRTAAVASAYALAQNAALQYRDSVKEVIGEKKAKEVEDHNAQKVITETRPNSTEVVVGIGNDLCRDELTGRYFMSDLQTLRSACNDISYEMMSEMWVSVNSFYDRVGLPPTEFGELMGWNAENGPLDIKYGSAVTEEGKSCLVIGFNRTPVPLSDKMFD